MKQEETLRDCAGHCRRRENLDDLVIKENFKTEKENIIYLELIYRCIYVVLLNYAGVG